MNPESDRNFTLAMRKLWGGLTVGITVVVALAAVLHGTGVWAMEPSTGPMMLFLAGIGTGSAGAWFYFRREASRGR